MPSTDTYAGDGPGAADPDQMLTRKEAAALLGYSVSTIKRWDREGILTPHRAERSPSMKADPRPRYRRADLLAAVKRAA